MLQLYNYFRSSASFRVRIALNLKGITYQDIPIHLLNNDQFSMEYQRIHPQNLVPALQQDEKVMTQSLAIIEYLDEVYPYPALFPSDLYQKALVRSFALAIIADIHPLNNLRILQYLTNYLHISPQQKTEWVQHWIAAGFSALEKQLTAWGLMGQYCFGNEPTVADICLVPQMYNARRYECDLTLYPLLTQIDAHCQQQEAFKNAWPQEK